MAFVKKTWLDRVATNLHRRVLNIVSNTSSTIVADISRGDSNITELGTPLNAENLNDLEDRIAAGFDAIKDMKGATSTADGESGLVPAPTKTERLFFLRGDGTWQAGGEAGEIPTASATTKGGIRVGDGLKMTGEVMSVPVMEGAETTPFGEDYDGTAGLVPKPVALKYNSYLHSSGVWKRTHETFDTGIIAVSAWSDGSSEWLDDTPERCGESSSKCYQYEITDLFNIRDTDVFEPVAWTQSGWSANVYIYCDEYKVVLQTARKPTGNVRVFGHIAH